MVQKLGNGTLFPILPYSSVESKPVGFYALTQPMLLLLNFHPIDPFSETSEKLSRILELGSEMTESLFEISELISGMLKPISEIPKLDSGISEISSEIPESSFGRIEAIIVEFFDGDRR